MLLRKYVNEYQMKINFYIDIAVASHENIAQGKNL